MSVRVRIASRATKSNNGIYKVEAGEERYEIVDAFVFGG
jgi:hypothetical protein